MMPLSMWRMYINICGKSTVATGTTKADCRSRVRGLARGAYAYSQFYIDYYRHFYSALFLTGMEGRMLVPLGIAFIVALFASTVVALTLTPVLCSYLLGKGKTDKDISREPFVARTLKILWASFGVGAASPYRCVGRNYRPVCGCHDYLFTLGRSFLPPFNEGSFTINVSTLPGISLEESDNIGRRAEELLLEVPEIQTVARKTGRAELDEHALGVNTSEIEAPLYWETVRMPRSLPMYANCR